MPSFLDFKLGARMLAKYPGLALVGGFGMAVATAIGVGTFAFVNTYLYPDIPLHEGERVVAIINLDARTGNGERHLLHDFVSWRADLRSFVDVSAFRTSQRNLIASAGQTGEPVSVAEMSGSGFRVARVPPLLGRVLVDADDRPEAPPVVVIGHDVWQARFQADPSIVGRTVRLNGVVHTVVGVMPAGFAFPISHSYWVPLRANPSAYERGAGPELDVFARLAPGSKKDEAQAELTVLGRRAAAANPKTHAQLEPRVVPFTDVFAKGEGATSELVIMQAMIAMILVLVCINVAILVYARTVTRTGEIAVRTALGATRVRIVTQLFTEAFVLSVLSALAGLGLVAIGLRYFDDLIVMISATGGVPFWIQPGLSSGTILYALALAVLAAAIVGILPALKATGAGLQTTLGNVKSGAHGRLGRTWTFLIVAQVAITVAVLPPVVAKAALLRAQATQRPGFAAEEVLAVALEREDVAPLATQVALIARIESSPVVTGVTFADGVPGDDSDDRIEIDGLGATHRIRTSRVGKNYFDVFDVKVGAGRPFNPADVAPALNGPVIVNRSLAEKVIGGGQVVGRRIRYTRDDAVAQPWHTIVGVVEDFPTGFKERGRTDAKVYHVAAPDGPEGNRLLIRLRGQTPAAFVATLREIAAATDPTLQLRRARALDVVYFERRRAMRMAALALTLVTGSILLLSSGGIYALMSFTVNQRRREIGIRAALGADARRILTSVLSRATGQLVLGVSAGLGLSVVVDRLTGGALMDGRGLVLVPGIAGFMAVVGLLAAAGPARRGLRVQPTEALRAE